MPRPSLLLPTILALLAAFPSAPAFAAPRRPAAPRKEAPADPVLEQAQALHKEGDAHYAKGDFARARAAYLAAWSLSRQPDLAGDLGEVEMRLGLHRDAAEHLAFHLRTSPQDSPPSPQTKRLFDAARAQVSALDILGDLDGAEILVDGKVVGTAPLEDPVFVEPGTHRVAAQLGTKLYTREVSAVRGRAVPVALALSAHEAVALPPPPPPSESEGDTAGWPPRRMFLPLMIGGAATLVGLGVGIGFTAAANGKASDIDGPLRVGDGEPSACHQSSGAACAQLGDAIDDLHAFTAVAAVGYAVGIASAAATSAYVFWPRKKDDASSRVSAAPWVVPGGAGLGVSGRF
jgi:hypothetical protein